MSHSRDQYFDIVKAFAIFLVVFGHVNSVLGLVPFPVWLGNMTVSINMPLFFIVSGYFCWPTVANGDWRRLGRHLRSYFQPTVVIIGAFTLLAPVAGLCSYAPASLIGYFGRRFLFSPWFIWTLAECYLICVFIGSLCQVSPNDNRRIWILLPIVWVLVMFVPNVNGVVYKTAVREMLPYFAIGGVFRSFNAKPWTDYRVGAISLLLFVLFLFCLNRPVNEYGMSFYAAKLDWHIFARTAIGVCGSVGVMWALWVTYEWLRRLEWLTGVRNLLASFGETTLGVYLLHQWILDRLTVCPQLFDSRVKVVCTAISLWAFCHCLSWGLAKSPRGNRWIMGR